MIHRSLSRETPIIAVRNFTAGYDGHVLLRDLSFDIYPGEVFVILGGSGSGKSTLLKHMIGLYRPVAGSILIEGRDIVTAQGQQRLEILSRIGVMYQQGALFGSMTLLENVRLRVARPLLTELEPHRQRSGIRCSYGCRAEGGQRAQKQRTCTYEKSIHSGSPPNADAMSATVPRTRLYRSRVLTLA